MRRKRIEEWGKGMTGMLLLICLVLCALLFKAYLDGKFHSVETLREYVAGFGIMAPLVLTAIQAAQVVLPVLPGFSDALWEQLCLDGWEDFGATTLESV